ncbi:hypothetical protein [Jiella pacifica]|uniref:Nucleotide-diphospho-sugar transferase n=1 Tax=Jiella pacifica TaxID=2696469 RepID=A0A6N9TBZ7_9HYPH|nr:hypothetical protein [Jiella pacifica]NDW06408.1 hypothetical protein [Jiella pacifica]
METEKSDRPASVDIIAKKRHSLFWRYRIRRRVRRALRDPDWALRRAEAFRRDVGGDLPKPSSQGIVLAACDDLYYHSFAPTLVRSIERHGVTQPVHLHLCAPRPETLADVAELSRSLRHVALSWTWDSGALAEGLPYRSIYLASARFLIAPLILESTGTAVLCVDVDAIANKPIWEHYAPVRAAADIVVIQRRDETSDSRRVRAGAFGMNPTPKGRRFAAALIGSLAATMPLKPRYHLDQIVIYYLMREFERVGSLAAADMPPELSDFGFEPETVIWMAKGWKMKSSSLFKDAQSNVEASFQPGGDAQAGPAPKK